jgi:hypothetical protein
MPEPDRKLYIKCAKRYPKQPLSKPIYSKCVSSSLYRVLARLLYSELHFRCNSAYIAVLSLLEQLDRALVNQIDCHLVCMDAAFSNKRVES